MRLVSIFYAVIAWGVVLLGVVHAMTTVSYAQQAPQGAVWFLGSGIAIVLTGVLNLLNRTYGRAARGLRIVSITNNLAMTGFATWAGFVTGASGGELLVVVGLVASATVLSFLAR
jgi:hypothetical protein